MGEPWKADQVILIEDDQCSNCGGTGTFKDARCLKDVCAHGGRWFSAKQMKARRAAAKEDEVPKPRTKRVMPCPSRPCPCPSGDEPRRKLNERARLQNKRIAKWERRA